MNVFALALLIVAVILFLLAGVGVGAGRFSLVAFGLAAWALAELVPAMAGAE